MGNLTYAAAIAYAIPEYRHAGRRARAPHRPLCSGAAVRPSTAIRAAAVTALAAGVAAPLVRRRLKLPPPVVTATAATAPFALCVLVPRSRARDVGTCVLQMWAYLATYEMPNDDPEALERRVQRRLPGQRRQVRSAAARRRRCGSSARSAATARSAAWEKLLVWSHWIWFAFPHGTVLFLLLRHRDRFPRGAGADLRDVRCRTDRLLGRPDRAARGTRRRRG